MPKKQKDIIEYIVCCVSEFSRLHQLTQRQAYAYLRQYRAIDFLQQHYDIEHTFSIDDTIDDIRRVCQYNGGQI